MRAGEPIRAELLYPIYADNMLVLPAHTVVTGRVVALNPDHPTRVHARFNADFTPFHKPVVRFDSIILAEGSSVPIVTGPVTDGAPIYRLVAPPPVEGGFLRRTVVKLETNAKERLSVFTAPEKGDRFVQFLYHQLPYHPERIAKDTAWTSETVAPVVLPQCLLNARRPSPATAEPVDPDAPPTWIVQAYLTTPISSKFSKAGEAISATVAEPILNPHGSVAVPQGSILTGLVNPPRTPVA
jgi:hypothetical protein